MASLEVLVTGTESTVGAVLCKAVAAGATAVGMDGCVTRKYRGNSDWLALYGAGDDERGAARVAHIEKQGRVAHWDLGYTRNYRDPAAANFRVSINDLHPHRFFDATPTDAKRWDACRQPLREDADPNGHVLVVGLGRKSRYALDIYDWEVVQLQQTQQRFPDRKILYRPKPQRDRDAHIIWEPRDGTSPIEQVLRGASLVICRHSNVAVDACVAGIPVECEDGAAYWLYSRGSSPSRDARLDFLHRLAYWQWKCSEMKEAWTFLQKVSASR